MLGVGVSGGRDGVVEGVFLLKGLEEGYSSAILNDHRHGVPQRYRFGYTRAIDDVAPVAACFVFVVHP